MNNIKSIIYTIITIVILLATLLGSIVLFPVMIGLIGAFIIYLFYRGYLDSKHKGKQDWREIGNHPLVYYTKDPKTGKYVQKPYIKEEE